MPRFLIHAVLALALLAAAGWATVGILRSTPPASEILLPGPRPVPVETLVLEPRAVERPISLVATLRAAREVVLSPEVGGRIAFVRSGLVPGATVDAEAVLLAVDVEAIDRELAAQRTSTALARARAAAAATDVVRAETALGLAGEALAVLRSEEKRWKDLAGRGRAEQARVDLARRQTLAAALTEEEAAARLATARAAVEITALEIQLSGDRLAVLDDRRARARVVAPFDGQFVPVSAGAPAPGVGSLLAPSEPIGTLVDVSRLRLVAEVHEDDVVALSLGAPVTARPISRPGLVLAGRVVAIGARVDPLTRSVVVEALFDEPAGLPAGTSARVVLEGEPVQDALWVDQRWIGFRGGRAVAFVVTARGADGAATVEVRELDLAPGLFGGGRIVRTGLAFGDEVVTSSIELLGAGGRVLVDQPRRGQSNPEPGR